MASLAYNLFPKTAVPTFLAPETGIPMKSGGCGASAGERLQIQMKFHLPAAHLLLFSLVPNRPQTDTSL